jgi:tetratricopeptide (TPR) repeat protein
MFGQERLYKDIRNIPYLFLVNYWFPRYDKTKDNIPSKVLYRPLVTTSYALNYLLAPDNKPWKYRLFNILLHCLNAILAYGAGRFILKRDILACLSALLFLVHPLSTESVVLITGRAGLLATSFILMGFIFFARYLSSKKRKRIFYGLALGSYALALLCKESAVIFPGLLFFYEFAFKRHPEAKGLWWMPRYLPLGLILAAYLLCRYLILGQVFSNIPYLGSNIYVNFLTATKTAGVYLQKSFLPLKLSLIYPGEYIRSLLEPRFIASLVALLACLIFIPVGLRRFRELSFGLGWFFVALLPALNLVPVGAVMAERWAYTSLVGFSFFVTTALRAISRRIFPWRSKLALGGLFLPLFISYSLLTFQRNLDWRDPLVFWSKAARMAPSEHSVHTALGLLYMGNKQYPQAERELKLARELNHDFPQKAAADLGLLYEEMGNYQEAIRQYRLALQLGPQALSTKPSVLLVRYNLARIYHKLGRIVQAQAEYEQALQEDPFHARAHYELGTIYENRANLPGAREQYRVALGLNPSYGPAQFRLSLLYDRAGLEKEAIQSYRRYLRLEPDSWQAHFNLGNLYARRQDLSSIAKAIKELKQAVKLSPDFAPAHNNLAICYLRSFPPREDLAARHIEQARSLGYPVNEALLEILDYIKEDKKDEE